MTRSAGKQVNLASTFCLLVDCVSPASAFRHLGQFGTFMYATGIVQKFVVEWPKFFVDVDIGLVANVSVR